MKREEMTKVVNEELMHIPRDKEYNTQAVFRALYNTMRRHHLTKGKTKEETITECVDYLKKEYPGCNPLYDKNFFRFDNQL